MRACLDACVLYPTILRELLLAAAEAQLFSPLWSPRILEEWSRAVQANHPDQATLIGAETALVRARFPEALIESGAQENAAFDLPDANDVHVLQCAIEGGADCLVTLNLKDFPPRVAARFDVRVLHPDLFMLELLANHPGQIATITQAVHQKSKDMGGLDLELRKLLKKARLPRFAKAMADVPLN